MHLTRGWVARWLGGEVARRERRAPRAPLGLEALEGRALLSHGGLRLPQASLTAQVADHRDVRGRDTDNIQDGPGSQGDAEVKDGRDAEVKDDRAGAKSATVGARRVAPGAVHSLPSPGHVLRAARRLHAHNGRAR